ncbi:MAG: aminotransferase class IV [Dehalococcoidia bacterium]
MTPADGPLAWVDGALVPREDARISIDDFAVRYGAACFETMLARQGHVFRAGAHLDRLERGLRAMGVRPPDQAALLDAIDETLRANGRADAAVRLTVTAGRGVAPALDAVGPPSVLVTVDALPSAPPPPRLMASTVRLDERRPLADAKHAQFLPYLLARAEARAAGFDDALLLNHAGALVEAATANVFLVLGDVLLTPALEDGALPGITRAALIEVAASLGVAVAEQAIPPAHLASASALLLTSSVAGVVPAASVDAAPPAVPAALSWAPATPAPTVVAALANAYTALVEEECGG